MELLRAAAQAATPTGIEAYPDDELGFALLYDTPPDLEAERARLVTLLEGDKFDLFAYGPEDPNQLILNFPGIPIEQSSDYMLAQGEALRQALDIVAVLPEVPSLYAPTEVIGIGPATEGLGEILQGFCWSEAVEPNDPKWALKLMKVDQAWASHNVSGNGILIAQPDTGVAEHRELDGGLRKDLGHNYRDGTRDPTDPLKPTMTAAGHGTRTSSTVISRSSHVIEGTAPGAHVVPLRAVNSVVLKGGRAVARSVDHATVNKCHVVTMSLGAGWPLWSLQKAIERAVADDLIVLAAAGNCVGKVTYPASDKNVIAVAAIDVHGNRWRGSCRGRAVDVAAPGENVHTATRLPNDGGDTSAIERRSQGTSFAVALTAGVAALWLEKFGREVVIAEARNRGTTVQELFRAALKASADTPVGWDTRKMGAGMVDANALLSLPLASIPGAATTEALPLIASLTEDDIPLHLQTEAGLVEMDWHLRSTPSAVPMLEAPLPPEMSDALKALVADAGPQALTTPALIAEPATAAEAVNASLRRLATGDGSGRESSETVTTESALERIKDTGAKGVLDIAEEALAHRAEAAPDKVTSDAQTEALDRMAPVLKGLVEDDAAILSGEGEVRAVLEALVRLTGRPAIRFQGRFKELDDPLLGSWHDDLNPIRDRWYPYVEAVGRIDVEVRPGEWVHAGTGLRLSDTQVLTNRHVIDVFAEQLPTPDGTPKFHLRRPAAICFEPEPTDSSVRFALPRIITAGARRIGRFVDLNKLDLAIMEMDPVSGTNRAPKAPDRGIVGLNDASVSQLLVAGYPAQPVRPEDQDGGPDPFWDRIDEIYGDSYGVKYISPGYVMNRPGAVPDDPRGWSYSHDATTLAGNSGSAILAMHGSVRLAGLHFGGARETRNLAHDLIRVKEGADGAFDTDLLPDPAG